MKSNGQKKNKGQENGQQRREEFSIISDGEVMYPPKKVTLFGPITAILEKGRERISFLIGLLGGFYYPIENGKENCYFIGFRTDEPEGTIHPNGVIVKDPAIIDKIYDKINVGEEIKVDGFYVAIQKMKFGCDKIIDFPVAYVREIEFIALEDYFEA